MNKNLKLGLGFGIFGVADFEFNIVTVIGSSLDALKEAPRIKLNKNIMVAFESDVSEIRQQKFYVVRLIRSNPSGQRSFRHRMK